MDTKQPTPDAIQDAQAILKADTALHDARATFEMVIDAIDDGAIISNLFRVNGRVLSLRQIALANIAQIDEVCK